MKLLKIVFFIGIFPAILLVSSCGTYYYYPTQQNVMQFKQKGDLNLNVNLDSEGFVGYRAGYALTDHVAVLSNFNGFGTSFHDDYMVDTEVILYTKVNKIFHPAVNLGYGFGEIDKWDNNYELGVQRQYIQPSFGASNEFFDFAISGRFTRVNYDLDKVKPMAPQTYDYQDFREVGQRDFYFFEPSVTADVGYKWIKLRGQYVVSEKLSSGSISYYTKPSLSLSLNVTFNMVDLFGEKDGK